MCAWFLVLVHVVVQIVLACHIHQMLGLSLRLFLLMLFEMTTSLKVYVIYDKALNSIVIQQLINLFLTFLHNKTQEAFQHWLICFAPHSILVNKTQQDLFQLEWLQVLFCQIYRNLANIEDFVMNIVWNAVAKNNKKVKKKLLECLVSRDHFGSDVYQH